MFVTDKTHVVIDVNGYFISPKNPTLQRANMLWTGTSGPGISQVFNYPMVGSGDGVNNAAFDGIADFLRRGCTFSGTITPRPVLAPGQVIAFRLLRVAAGAALGATRQKFLWAA